MAVKELATKPFVWVLEEQRLGKWVAFYDNQDEAGIIFPPMMQAEANRTARNMTRLFGVKMRASKYERSV